MLVVGGGPFGTARAFRAKELGLAALVIDYDDLMKRIRDYAKDKPILPDFGGGDTMQFPEGGELIRSLQFEADRQGRDVRAVEGALPQVHVPAQIGVELTGLEPARRHLARDSAGITARQTEQSTSPATCAGARPRRVRGGWTSRATPMGSPSR